jgi:hypothetical protein
MIAKENIDMDTAVAIQDQVLAPQGLSPGIYFGLPEDRYHADVAIGSTDIRGILRDHEAWWRASRLNPNQQERAAYAISTKATVVGTAMHKLVLEGMPAFERAYVRRPDDAPGSLPSDKGNLTKQANAAARQSGRISLHGDEWSLCTRTQGLIEAHPDLSSALRGGANEVSVFWRRHDGIMCKARFDRLKAGGVGDLKSIENESHKRLEVACRYDIARRRYDIQAEHYLEARAQLPSLFAAYEVFMIDVHGVIERAVYSNSAGSNLQLLTECATLSVHKRLPDGTIKWMSHENDAELIDEEGYGFQFLFVQKSSPGVWSCTVYPGNPILDTARDSIERAFKIYRDQQRIVSPGQPWRPTWRVQELAVEELPAFYGRE